MKSASDHASLLAGRVTAAWSAPVSQLVQELPGLLTALCTCHRLPGKLPSERGVSRVHAGDWGVGVTSLLCQEQRVLRVPHLIPLHSGPDCHTRLSGTDCWDGGATALWGPGPCSSLWWTLAGLW